MRTWKPENTIPKEFRYLPSGFIYVIIACTRTIWPVGWENILLHGQYMTWCGIFPLYPPSSRSASRSISCFLARVHESFQIFFISPNYQPLYNKQSFCVILPRRRYFFLWPHCLQLMLTVSLLRVRPPESLLRPITLAAAILRTVPYFTACRLYISTTVLQHGSRFRG